MKYSTSISLALLGLFVVLAPELLGQSPLAEQRLGRGYWHVFVAYALCWLIIGGWLVPVQQPAGSLQQFPALQG